MPLEPFPQEVRLRIDVIEIAIPGEDRVHLFFFASVLVLVAELGVRPSPDAVPGRRYTTHRQIVVAEQNNHEAALIEIGTPD